MQNRLFRIPNYQRAYSWGERQRFDLFEDIREAARSGRDHFMATVVALAREKRLIDADEFNVVELVDGQQRLTTLVVLFKAIEKAFDADQETKGNIRNDLRRMLVKGDDHNLVLLQTNHDSSDVFASYIRDGKIRKDEIVTAADANVTKAAEECELFVAKWQETEGLTDLVATIRHKLSMIYHELNDEETVYRVFVLNSRGLDVRWIDKTKSQIMASICEYAEPGSQADGLHEVQNTFKYVYRLLGLDTQLGAEALRFAGTFSNDKPSNRVLSEQDASAELLRAAGESLATIIKSATWLKTVVGKVVDLHNDQRRSATISDDQRRSATISDDQR